MYEYAITYSYTDYDGCDRQTSTFKLTIPQDLSAYINAIAFPLCIAFVGLTEIYDPATISILSVEVHNRTDG